VALRGGLGKVINVVGEALIGRCNNNLQYFFFAVARSHKINLTLEDITFFNNTTRETDRLASLVSGIASNCKRR
jgi:hypothetical protein